MEAFSFGSYYPGDSAIHRLDPRTKLLLGFVFLSRRSRSTASADWSRSQSSLS